MQLGVSKSYHEFTPERSGHGAALGIYQKLSIPYIISAIAEASDFKFGTQLGLAKAHHKIILQSKSERGPGLGELPNLGNLGVLLISLMAETADFNFGMQLNFTNIHHKIIHKGKLCMSWIWSF